MKSNQTKRDVTLSKWLAFVLSLISIFISEYLRALMPSMNRIGGVWGGWRAAVVAGLLLGSKGCGDDGTDDGAETTPATSNDPSTSSTAGSTSAADSTTGTPPSSESGEPSTTTAADPSSSGDTPSSSDSTGADACAPAAEDTACYTCAKEMCCAEYAECAADPDCLCAVDCTLMGNDPFGCLRMCNDAPQGPAMNLGICMGTTCAADCTG